MHRYFLRGAAAAVVSALLVGGTAGVSEAAVGGPSASFAGHGPTTPFLITWPGIRTIYAGGNDTDTALVIGNFLGATPSGSVSFTACGPLATPAPCTSPNLGPDVVPFGFSGFGLATATDTFHLNNPGWFCLLVTYSGDAHYNPVSDNSLNECVHVLPAPVPEPT
ncbi:MAG TPA: hypothetical protein VN799_03640 [Acidimicrobiales bacterium]|nr:hypothetical protein [Acidimicrobiales bacterium]